MFALGHQPLPDIDVSVPDGVQIPDRSGPPGSTNPNHHQLLWNFSCGMFSRGLRVGPLSNSCQFLFHKPKLVRASRVTILIMPPQKRKTSSSSTSNGTLSHTNKRGKPDLTRPHPHAKDTEDFDIVLRDFYPPEMCNERCEAYNNGTLERPIEALQKAYEDTVDERKEVRPNAAVVHWFKSDLRLHDNRGLQMAYQVARENNIPLIALYILSPEDLTAHLASAPRVDLTLRTLGLLRRDLNELDIPLYMETQNKRKEIPQRIVDLCQEWGAKHLFANMEYEVDELRRDAKLVRLCAENGIRFEAAHDTCVVTPGKLTSQQGKQYAVYSPWFRAWCAFLKENPEYLEVADEPGSNPGNARKHFKELFDCEVPAAPDNKRLSEAEKERFHQMYPEGEHEALRRLEAFLEEKGRDYDDLRNILAGRNTSVLSPYFASGALSARTAVVQAQKANKGQLNRNQSGYMSWISEVAWRDFYKHVLVHWPFIWFVCPKISLGPIARLTMLMQYEQVLQA